MKKILLLVIFLFIIMIGCTPQKKSVGGSCSSNDMCENYKCRNGFCDFSDKGEYCTKSGYCRGDLICKENKCIEMGLLCELRDLAGFSKSVGMIMLALLIVGSFYPLPTAAFGASITHGGTRVVGYILIMAIFIALGFYLSGSCF